MVHSEIREVLSMNRKNLLKKREKQDKNDSLTLVLTYHPALNKVHGILKKAHRRTIRYTITPSSYISQSKNTERSFSKIKAKDSDSNDEENGIYKCANINCDICNILYLSNEFQSTVTGKRYHMNFKFD